MARRTPICAEQDCGEHTSRSDHPLCYPHWVEFQEGIIDECPTHPEVCKPAEYDSCRQCYGENRKTIKTTLVREKRERYRTRGSGWDKFSSEAKAIPPSTEAVLMARKNMSEHGGECTLHESNTIQYLVEPILKGLGWDFGNPQEVRREFNPEGKRPFRNKAVDIALLEDGAPKVFVEAKRLDRDYDHDYKKQIDKYASHMDRGIAVLTNGQFWIVSPVYNGKTEKWEIINIDEGPAEDIARRLHEVLGKSRLKEQVCIQGSPDSRLSCDIKEDLKEHRVAEAKRRKRPSYDIRDDLKEYRDREAKRRKRPAYTIFTDKTINSIAAYKPSSLPELERIKGVGPATLEEHGTSILNIVEGQ